MENSGKNQKEKLQFSEASTLKLYYLQSIRLKDSRPPGAESGRMRLCFPSFILNIRVEKVMLPDGFIAAVKYDDMRYNKNGVTNG